MRFIAHYSSSAGNLYEVVAANGKRLLIECGVTWKKLQKTLHYDLSNIEGCLLTHEHDDHSHAVEDVMAAEIDVYSSLPTFEALGVDEYRRAKVVGHKERWEVADGKTFECLSFVVSHDPDSAIVGHDVPCLGFIINDKPAKEYLLFVTDTSCIKPQFAIEFNIIAICCNHDSTILRARVDNGDMNRELGDRCLQCHMNADTTKDYIRRFCNTDKCTEIWLLHCSRDNLNAEKTRAEIESEFFCKSYIAGQAAKAHPSSRPGPPASFEGKDDDKNT
jgi:phosphoribosyl 1,2-cyclic phosphodiesterase